jgi:hypothetical protein
MWNVECGMSNVECGIENDHENDHEDEQEDEGGSATATGATRSRQRMECSRLLELFWIVYRRQR